MTDAHALYRRWLPELWNSDPAAMHDIAAEIFAPDVVAHWGPGRDYAGPAAVADMVRQSAELFDDVEVILEQGPVVDGDLVAARWTFAGRVRDTMPGMPAEPGTPVRYHGMDLMRIADGRFAEYWPHGDNLSLMRQLGMADNG